MNLDEAYFRQILAQLVAENPLACRALLSLARLEFTDAVPTLAVTLTAPPVLKVNLGFMRAHCRSEEDVEALLLHEFLHVLLRHTQRLRSMTPLLNVALDAVINATLHRLAGTRISGFFSHFYREAPDILRLLRPPTPEDPSTPGFGTLWNAIYRGTIAADEVYRLLCDEWVRAHGTALPAGWLLLGNHDDADPGPAGGMEGLPDDLTRVFRQTCEVLGHRLGIPLPGRDSVLQSEPRPEERVARWLPVVRRVFHGLTIPDRRRRPVPEPGGAVLLPVPHPGDRRAALRALWSPILPFAAWPLGLPRRPGSVRLYLDVSGSMNDALSSLVTLLLQVQQEIRRPLWAFSGHVARAEFDRGTLRTRSDGATSLRCVMEHFLASPDRKAVLVTDGEVGPVPGSLRARLRGRAMHALVLPGGSGRDLAASGIPFTLLP